MGKLRTDAQIIRSINKALLGFFDNDVEKVSLWLRTKNPLIGQMTPMELLYLNPNKVERFILDRIEGNIP